MKTIKKEHRRIEFYFTDAFGKETLGLSTPHNFGDGSNGRLARDRRMIIAHRNFTAPILRSEHGFQGKISIRVKYLIDGQYVPFKYFKHR